MNVRRSKERRSQHKQRNQRHKQVHSSTRHAIYSDDKQPQPQPSPISTNMEQTNIIKKDTPYKIKRRTKRATSNINGHQRKNRNRNRHTHSSSYARKPHHKLSKLSSHNSNNTTIHAISPLNHNYKHHMQSFSNTDTKQRRISSIPSTTSTPTTTNSVIHPYAIPSDYNPLISNDTCINNYYSSNSSSSCSSSTHTYSSGQQSASNILQSIIHPPPSSNNSCCINTNQMQYDFEHNRGSSDIPLFTKQHRIQMRVLYQQQMNDISNKHMQIIYNMKRENKYLKKKLKGGEQPSNKKYWKMEEKMLGLKKELKSVKKKLQINANSFHLREKKYNRIIRDLTMLTTLTSTIDNPKMDDESSSSNSDDTHSLHSSLSDINELKHSRCSSNTPLTLEYGEKYNNSIISTYVHQRQIATITPKTSDKPYQRSSSERNIVNNFKALKGNRRSISLALESVDEKKYESNAVRSRALPLLPSDHPLLPSAHSSSLRMASTNTVAGGAVEEKNEQKRRQTFHYSAFKTLVGNGKPSFLRPKSEETQNILLSDDDQIDIPRINQFAIAYSDKPKKSVLELKNMLDSLPSSYNTKQSNIEKITIYIKLDDILFTKDKIALSLEINASIEHVINQIYGNISYINHKYLIIKHQNLVINRVIHQQQSIANVGIINNDIIVVCVDKNTYIQENGSRQKQIHNQLLLYSCISQCMLYQNPASLPRLICNRMSKIVNCEYCRLYIKVDHQIQIIYPRDIKTLPNINLNEETTILSQVLRKKASVNANNTSLQIDDKYQIICLCNVQKHAKFNQIFNQQFGDIFTTMIAPLVTKNTCRSNSIAGYVQLCNKFDINDGKNRKTIIDFNAEDMQCLLSLREILVMVLNFLKILSTSHSTGNDVESLMNVKNMNSDRVVSPPNYDDIRLRPRGISHSITFEDNEPSTNVNETVNVCVTRDVRTASICSRSTPIFTPQLVGALIAITSASASEETQMEEIEVDDEQYVDDEEIVEKHSVIISANTNVRQLSRDVLDDEMVSDSMEGLCVLQLHQTVTNVNPKLDVRKSVHYRKYSKPSGINVSSSGSSSSSSDIELSFSYMEDEAVERGNLSVTRNASILVHDLRLKQKPSIQEESETPKSKY